jgi:ferredoxin-NADP reductase/DMSO/TMAO reductase YedYZ heme-binding membrane subunit
VQTTSVAVRPAPARVDTAFARRLVFANAGVPIVLLGWDAYQRQLGANGVNFAIHTTGLVGLVLLLLSLAITPARRLTGWAWLIALRRTLGLYAFFYLCVHFAIFFLFDRAASVGGTAREILLRTYLQIGTLGLLLLVPLAVTSTDSMVTRLGPKRWKRLHRLTYLASAFGALHYYLLVKADVRQPLVFAGVLAVLLAFRPVEFYRDARARRAERRARAARPATARERRFWTGELRVLRVADETPDVRTFRLGLDGARLPFAHEPGQYLNIALTIDGERVKRSYTIASSPTQTSYCEVTIKRTTLGRASRYVHAALHEGATVKISAPAGRFVFTGGEGDGVVLLAGGVGITPLMAIVRYLTDTGWPGTIHLVFAVRTKRDVIFSGELERLANRFPNLRRTVTLSGALSPEEASTWAGSRGRISAALLARVVPEIARLPVYLCGPAGMMVETRAMLLGLGVPDAQIKTEAFESATTVSVDPRESAIQALPVGESAENSVALAAPRGATGGVPTVDFRRSMKLAELPPDRTILEVAEDAGLELPFECRSGICGQCKTRLLEGRVTMDVEDALSPADKAKGIILACQARSAGDVAIDA